MLAQVRTAGHCCCRTASGLSEVWGASAAACEATGQHGEVKAAPSGAGSVHQCRDHCHAPERQMGSGTWQLQGQYDPCMPNKATSWLFRPQLDCNPHHGSSLLYNGSASTVRHLAITIRFLKEITRDGTVPAYAAAVLAPCPASFNFASVCSCSCLQEEDHMEPEPHYEDFRTLRRKIFEWEGKCHA